MTEPAPDHMCVFVCDLQIVKGCFGRSVAMTYGSREINGWHVIPGRDEFVVCYPCYGQFA